MSNLIGRVSQRHSSGLLAALNNHAVTFTGSYPPPEGVNVLYTFVDYNSSESQKFMREVRSTRKLSIFFHAPLVYGFDLRRLAALYNSNFEDSSAIYRYMDGSMMGVDLEYISSDAYAHINNSHIYYGINIAKRISNILPISFLNGPSGWEYLIGCGQEVKREIARFA